MSTFLSELIAFLSDAVSVDDLRGRAKELLLKAQADAEQRQADTQERERLQQANASLCDERDALRAQCAPLTEQNDKLVAENAALRAQTHPGFVEWRGALFKRMPGGGYHWAVFCPDCHRATSSEGAVKNYACKPCDWAADFSRQELAHIITKELPR